MPGRLVMVVGSSKTFASSNVTDLHLRQQQRLYILLPLHCHWLRSDMEAPPFLAYILSSSQKCVYCNIDDKTTDDMSDLLLLVLTCKNKLKYYLFRVLFVSLLHKFF